MSSMCFSNFCILFLLSNPSAAEKISSAPFCAASIFFSSEVGWKISSHSRKAIQLPSAKLIPFFNVLARPRFFSLITSFILGSFLRYSFIIPSELSVEASSIMISSQLV